MIGTFWSTGIRVRVDRASAEVCDDERLWAYLDFEDDGHAGHPDHLRRGGIRGTLRCRYGLGPGQPEDVRTGILQLIEDAKRLGIAIASAGNQRPAFYVADDEQHNAASARRQITPLAEELGWEVF